MLRSFSKGLEKNWKAATKGISKGADKGFDKIAHGTFDKSDHWHSEYVDDGYIYDLKLRRDKVKKEAEGAASTGRFKFSWEKKNQGEKHTAEGTIEYREGELLLYPDWWLVQSPNLEVKFETSDAVEEAAQGNGCYVVPPGFMDIVCTRMDPGENGLPTFNVEIHPPETGKNSRTLEKTAVKGNKWEFEVYLPTSE